MLWSWMDSLQQYEREKWRRYVAEDFEKQPHERIFTSQIAKVFEFNEWEKAVEVSDVVASQGKVLLSLESPEDKKEPEE